MEIADIIKKVEAGDNVNAGKAFDTVMGQKLKDALDAKKIELATSMVHRKVPKIKKVINHTSLRACLCRPIRKIETVVYMKKRF